MVMWYVEIFLQKSIKTQTHRKIKEIGSFLNHLELLVLASVGNFVIAFRQHITPPYDDPNASFPCMSLQSKQLSKSKKEKEK